MQRRREIIQLQAVRTSEPDRTANSIFGMQAASADVSSGNDRGVGSLEGGQMRLRNDGSNRSTSSVIDEQMYPAVDRGRDAWLMLAGSCILQLPIWGYSQAFGIFQEYYTNQDSTLQGSKDSVPVIGAACTGVLYLLSPICFAVLTKYPQLRPWCGIAGLCLALVGFVASAFAVRVWQLILTQGFISAIGCGLLFGPTTLYMNEWFIDRKGLALGIMWAGKSGVGVVLPFAAQHSLSRFGAKATLIAWTVVVAISTAPVLKFIKPRIPAAATSSGSDRRLLGANFLRMPSFWVFQTSNALQALGYFIPSIYLYSYATSALGYSASVGTAITAAINASSVIGGIVLGFLCDRYPVSNVILVSSLGSALSVFIFWGLSSPVTNGATAVASSYFALTVFAVVYGFFAGGFSSCWSGVMKQLKREAPALESGLMFGFLAGSRGIGNVISGPISAALLDKGSLNYGASSYARWLPGYETQYGSVIVFTGITALLGAGSWYWQRGRACICR